MPERPLGLFPNNKIVDKTLIAIEQIFAVHYEKPFFLPFFALCRRAKASASNARKGGGGAERGGCYVARVSRDGAACASPCLPEKRG